MPKTKVLALAVVALVAAISQCASAKSLTITQPNGGEVFYPGDTVVIQWSPTPANEWYGTDFVRLEYSLDSGANWTKVPLLYGDGLSVWYSENGKSCQFSWGTSGLPDSQHCRVRVVSISPPGYVDASDSDFTISSTQPPLSIVHTKLTDTGNTITPYRVNATITAAGGISSAKVVWSRNGSAFSEAAMTPRAGGSYSGDIPAGSRIGDRFCYYIEAQSNTGSVLRSPSLAPAETHCFSITPCAKDSFLPDGALYFGSMSLNYYACTVDSTLTEIEQSIIDVPPLVNFVVYESGAGTGTYYKVFSKETSQNLSLNWYSSGPISVPLRAGKFYAIGVFGSEVFYEYYVYTGGPIPTEFGAQYSSTLDIPGYLPYGFNYSGFYSQPATTRQRLSTCRVGRSISLMSPATGSKVDPGNPIPVAWTLEGVGWKPDDTLKVEVSTDGGATWVTAQGGASVSASTGLLDVPTADLPESDHCLVRVSTNDNLQISAASGEFILRVDDLPPAISHVPLADTSSVGRPIKVCATITDDYGIKEATLCWQVNGGSFSQVAMEQTAGTNEYCAEIPGPYQLDSDICYYIEARDTSVAGHASREPWAPGGAHCFHVAACSTEDIGLDGGASDRLAVSGGNLAANKIACETSSQLRMIEQYLDIPAGELVWQISMADNEAGPYWQVFRQSVQDPGGEGWRSSGPITWELQPGKFYRIGAILPDGSFAYYGKMTRPLQVSFGRILEGVSEPVLPGAGDLYRQRLSTCRVPRSLYLHMPRGTGPRVEPGQTVNVWWYSGGVGWSAGDTISLFYSTDSGATWNPIAGAGALPFASEHFDWDTSGLPESQHYRVRVVANQDSGVFDQSVADFPVKLDSDWPVIVHSPLPDVLRDNKSSSYTARAAITDGDLGVDPNSVRLWWRRNGGPWSSSPMVMSAGQYITTFYPSPGINVGDLFEYYIEAADLSVARHTARSPETGYHAFRVLPPPESLVELFNTDSFDLSYTSVTFTPNPKFVPGGAHAYYTVCAKPIAQLPSDTSGGTSVYSFDDESYSAYLYGTNKVRLFGEQFSSFNINCNGYVTFGASDNRSVESYPAHFALKRISALFHDLVAPYGPPPLRITWREYGDRAAVTWSNVSEKGTSNSNTFQIEMFFDGKITLNYLRMDAARGLVGLSSGTMPQSFWETDFSGSPSCCTQSFSISDSALPADDGLMGFGVLDVGTAASGQAVVTNTGQCPARLDGIRLARVFEDFSDGLAQGWQETSDSAWQVQSGQYLVASVSGITSPLSMYTAATFGDFYCQAKIRSYEPAPAGLQLVFRAQSNFSARGGSAYLVRLEPVQTGTARVTLVRQYFGGSQILAQSDPVAVSLTDWNTIGVNVLGPSIDVFLNENLVATATDATMREGWIGLWALAGQSSVQQISIDDILVTEPRTVGAADTPYSCDGFTLIAPPTLPVLLQPGESLPLQFQFSPPAMGQWTAFAGLSLLGPVTPPLKLTGAGRSFGVTSDIRALKDGSPVYIGGKVVTAVFADRFYVQDLDRTSGIGVLWNGPMPALWTMPRIDGTMKGSADERVIQASAVTPGALAGEQAPLQLSCFAMCGGNFRYDPGPAPGGGPVTGQKGVLHGAGGNNVGLLVGAWGRVVDVDPTGAGGWFSIEDGSGINEPAGRRTSRVRALLPPGMSPPPLGSYVLLRGVSSCLIDGSGTERGLYRQVRLRDAGDLTAL